MYILTTYLSLYVYHLIYIVMTIESIQLDQHCLALSRTVSLVDTLWSQRYHTHLHLCGKVLLPNATRKNFPCHIIILQLILTLRNN